MAFVDAAAGRQANALELLEISFVESNMRTSNIRESLSLLRERGLPVEEVLDVGVLHGTPVLMQVYGDKLHHLFEPVDEYFPKIAENYKGLQYKLVHAAVSDADGEILLQSVDKTGAGIPTHSWITDVQSSCAKRVPNMRLDSYCGNARLSGPLLLKIDVDGSAIPSAILRGAESTLRMCSVVVIEMTVEHWFDRAALLNAAGFDLWDVVALCYYGDCLWQFDAIFVNRNYKKSLTELSPIHHPPFAMARWQQG